MLAHKVGIARIFAAALLLAGTGLATASPDFAERKSNRSEASPAVVHASVEPTATIPISDPAQVGKAEPRQIKAAKGHSREPPRQRRAHRAKRGHSADPIDVIAARAKAARARIKTQLFSFRVYRRF
jgi:hypothetical protein